METIRIRAADIHELRSYLWPVDSRFFLYSEYFSHFRYDLLKDKSVKVHRAVGDELDSRMVIVEPVQHVPSGLCPREVLRKYPYVVEVPGEPTTFICGSSRSYGEMFRVRLDPSAVQGVLRILNEVLPVTEVTSLVSNFLGFSVKAVKAGALVEACQVDTAADQKLALKALQVQKRKALQAKNQLVTRKRKLEARQKKDEDQVKAIQRRMRTRETKMNALCPQIEKADEVVTEMKQRVKRFKASK